jgi:hypothetical protein
MKFSTKQVKGLLPKQVHMAYGWKDVLEDAVQFEGGVHEIDCVDDPENKGDFVAIYRLVRVEKKKKR